PDSVRLLSDDARPLLTYAQGQIAGLVASTCLPYRVAYLGSGLEGVGPASERAQTLAKLID
ncbi:MAG: hypothetical protein LC737_07350, partial [Chloroflexi bacterium]|nr:hypothetical protein [Chloroflexota bacterium]